MLKSRGSGSEASIRPCYSLFEMLAIIVASHLWGHGSLLRNIKMTSGMDIARTDSVRADVPYHGILFLTADDNC